MPHSPPIKPFLFPTSGPSITVPLTSHPTLLTWLILSIPQFSAATAFPQRGLPSQLSCVLPVILFHRPLCPLSHSSALTAIYNFCSCSIYVFLPWVPHRCKCQEVKNHFCFAHHCMPASVTIPELNMYVLQQCGMVREAEESKGCEGPRPGDGVFSFFGSTGD